jgi:hypothetical protein
VWMALRFLSSSLFRRCSNLSFFRVRPFLSGLQDGSRPGLPRMAALLVEIVHPLMSRLSPGIVRLSQPAREGYCALGCIKTSCGPSGAQASAAEVAPPSSYDIKRRPVWKVDRVFARTKASAVLGSRERVRVLLRTTGIERRGRKSLRTVNSRLTEVASDRTPVRGGG